MMTLKLPYQQVENFILVPKKIVSGELPILDRYSEIHYRKIIPLWEMCVKFEASKRPNAGKLIKEFEKVIKSPRGKIERVSVSQFEDIITKE
jgi:hypothetical protein